MLIWRDAQYAGVARNGAAGLVGAGAAMREAAGRDGRDRWPGEGGGVHPFHLESITAGGDCAVLRIGGDIDVYAAPRIRDRVAAWPATAQFTSSRTCAVPVSLTRLGWAPWWAAARSFAPAGDR